MKKTEIFLKNIEKIKKQKIELNIWFIIDLEFIFRNNY